MKPNRRNKRDFIGGWFDRLTTNGIMGWFITNEIEGLAYYERDWGLGCVDICVIPVKTGIQNLTM